MIHEPREINKYPRLAHRVRRAISCVAVMPLFYWVNRPVRHVVGEVTGERALPVWVSIWSVRYGRPNIEMPGVENESPAKDSNQRFRTTVVIACRIDLAWNRRPSVLRSTGSVVRRPTGNRH